VPAGSSAGATVAVVVLGTAAVVGTVVGGSVIAVVAATAVVEGFSGAADDELHAAANKPRPTAAIRRSGRRVTAGA
jgi:hypothetical protein